MEADRETLKWVVGISKPQQVVSNEGLEYYDKQLTIPPKEPSGHPLLFNTLSGVIGYVNAGLARDAVDAKSLFVVVGDGGREVEVVGSLKGRHHQRVNLALARPLGLVRQDMIGAYVDLDKFNLFLRCNFEARGDFDAVLSVTERVRGEEVQEVVDDGISTRVTVAKGVGGKEWAAVPREVTLVPRCTFPEVAQPERRFILRVRSAMGDFSAGIFSADNDSWMIGSSEDVGQYLRDGIASSDPIVLW